MRRTSYEQMNCSIASALDVVGEPWTLLIVRDAFYGVRRFDDFQENLGIARNVLTARLKKLVEAGIFRKTAYRQRPLRHEYRLTDKGAALFTVIVGLKQWGDRWRGSLTAGRWIVDAATAGRSSVLIDAERPAPELQRAHFAARARAGDARLLRPAGAQPAARAESGTRPPDMRWFTGHIPSG
jgi:DNA-binding HxlR family transcriptional regulator